MPFPVSRKAFSILSVWRTERIALMLGVPTQTWCRCFKSCPYYYRLTSLYFWYVRLSQVFRRTEVGLYGLRLLECEATESTRAELPFRTLLSRISETKLWCFLIADGASHTAACVRSLGRLFTASSFCSLFSRLASPSRLSQIVKTDRIHKQRLLTVSNLSQDSKLSFPVPLVRHAEHWVPVCYSSAVPFLSLFHTGIFHHSYV